MRIRPASVRVRLTLWYTAVLAVTVLALFVAIFLAVRAGFIGQLDRQVEAEFQVVSQDVAEDVTDLSELQDEVPGRLFEIRRDGALLFETAAFKDLGLGTVAADGASSRKTILTPAGAAFRLRSGPVASGVILTVAVSEEPIRRALKTLVVILVLALPVSLALAALGGSLLAGRLLRPVAQMAARAEKISAESLSARLPVEDPRDEFGRMAGVINNMLSRLEGSFDRLRRFTADASHELRTPLTVIQSVGEVALQEDLDASTYRDRIGSMLEEVGRLSQLVDSLLTLTRADAGAIATRRKEIDASALAVRAVDDLRPLAEEKRQDLTLTSAGEAHVLADEPTLRLALVNLLDNAIKYSPPSGPIVVAIRVKDGEVLIEVADNGPGIPAEQAARVFDRFYRADPSRSSRAGGAGLGLAIAKWAIEVNGGRIELESQEGRGSTFRLVLPRMTRS